MNTRTPLLALVLTGILSVASAEVTHIVVNDPPGGGTYRGGFLDSLNFAAGTNSSLWEPDLTKESQVAMAVGQILTGTPMDIPTAREAAMFFVLPDLEGHELQSATLRLRYSGNAHEDPGIAELGPVTLWYDITRNTGGIGQVGFGGGIRADATVVDRSSEPGRWYEIDVTSIVAEDYAQDPADSQMSYFRLQMDNVADFVTASGANRYMFSGGENPNNKPELIIIAAPKP